METEITVDRLKECLAYNQETGVFVWKNPRKHSLKGAQAGRAHKKRGYREIYIFGRLHYAHRLAWLYMTGEMPKKLIDHIDHNKDNNSWPNLREVDYSVNGKHRAGAQSNSKTGIKGVSSNGSGYRARIFEHGKQICFGTFKNIADAVQAYEAGIAMYRMPTGESR